MKIITGNTGMKHVTSDDDGAIYASIIGKDDYVLDMNDNFSYEVIDTNTIKINSGDALLNGRHIRTPRGSYDLVSIDNGQTGYNRIDLIVIRYESNGEIEQAYLHVIKGEQTTGVASVPTYETESILNRALIHDMPLFEVHLNGINLEEVKKVFGAKNLSTTNLGYRPNLLINSDFRNPINQRGQTSYASVDGSYTCVYSIDRWRLQLGCCLTVNDDSINLTSNRASGTCAFQYVPEFVYEENNYTIQVNVKSLTNNANLTIYGTGAKVVLQKALSVGNNVFSIENSDIMLVQFDITKDTVLEIEYIKLERGSIATPLVPRPYGEELALCQRYFDMITGIRAIGVESNTSTKRFMYSIPRTSVMRTTPTITIGGNVIENSVSGICVRECENCVMYTGLSFSYEARPRELLIAVNFAGSFPNKKPNETQIYISDNFYIYLDAEIY